MELEKDSDIHSARDDKAFVAMGTEVQHHGVLVSVLIRDSPPVLRLMDLPGCSVGEGRLDKCNAKAEGGREYVKANIYYLRDNINTRRECILRCIIYLNEDPDTIFKEYLALATEDAERDLATTVM
ncbi:sterile alpha motif domain-containing protein 3-like [Pimephales promelas]|nr:sterile alpha motif domain-containing protein 3-like [Pimephales promelas]